MEITTIIPINFSNGTYGYIDLIITADIYSKLNKTVFNSLIFLNIIYIISLSPLQSKKL